MMTDVQPAIAYTGIGARKTPRVILAQMQEIGYQAATLGWILRSGGAVGADSAFELGCDDASGHKEIYLPWRGFNDHPSQLVVSMPAAFKIAEAIHPLWPILSQSNRNLVSRNMHQILGPSLTQCSKCVVCWTPDGAISIEQYGKHTGGTGTAIALASVNNVPIFNLQRHNQYQAALDFMFATT